MILIFSKNLQNQKNQSKKKERALIHAIILLNEEQKVLNAFESGKFPEENQRKGFNSILDHVAKISDRKQLKILTRKN